jgi:hypothetical protein
MSGYIPDCGNCGMTEKDRCECDAVPGGLFKCWRPNGTIMVWEDEECVMGL